MARHDDEQLLNGELARLLRAQGLDARAEVREAGRKMDVVASAEGLRVVLEAEAGSSKRRQAIGDADARLRQGLTTLAVAVCYPDGATVAGLADATLAWTLRTLPPARDARWREGPASALADAVRHAPAALGGADKAAQVLSLALDGAVQRLPRAARSALARALDLPERDDGRTAAKRGLLVAATAMLFHHRLQQHLPPDAPDGWTGAWPPAPPAACAAHGAPAQAHREAWNAILAVDYRPVFETAIVALTALPASPDTSQMLRELAGSVEAIAAQTVGLRHDLLGRIFHRVLDTAPQDGSFYTSTAAATLLAALAVRAGDADWSDPDAVARLRVCDPACGTGTLLMAACERIRALRRAAGPVDADAEALIAEALVEDVLWGYDINLTATHMAASTLGMLSPRTQFRRMNIHRTRLGVIGDQAYVGSLEFLAGEGGQPRLAAWPTLSRQVDAPEAEAAPPPPPMDLVIMNPPFTRDSLRHDQFSKADEQAIKQREKDMMAGRDYRAGVRLSGSSSAFLALGERLAGDRGTLAAVLPAMLVTGPAGSGTRRYLASRFRIDTIVSSHDPERIWFSENTSIGEVLLVCRRRADGGEPPPTRVVNLARNPETPEEAMRLIDHLERGDETDWGVVQRVPAARIEAGDWYAVNFLSPWLPAAFRELAERTVPLSEIAEVGPEGRRIRDAYRRSDLPTASGRRALWHHKTGVTQSMRARTDSSIEPKDARRHLADRYWEQRSRLLLPDRLRLNLARATATMLDSRAVGSRWVPTRPHDGEDATAAALCAWLNSSAGVLALLAERNARVPDYPSFSLDALRSLRAPDFGERPGGRDTLAAAFGRLRDAALAPLPRMADDPVRRELDEAAADALGLDAERLARIRDALSREPSVTGRRHGDTG